MAVRVIKVPLGDGTDDFVEVQVESRDLGGVDLVADDGAERAPFTLAGSLSRVLPAISHIFTTLRGAAHAPDEIGMELGLTFGGETGLIFAKGTAEATFTVTMTWHKPAAERGPIPEGGPGGP